MTDGAFSGEAEQRKCYALVFYANGPLAEFLDGLRSELEPAHPAPRSHVTVLPPRPLPRDEEAARQQLGAQASEFHSFETILGSVDSFNGTNVVYLSVAYGFQNLHHMHRRLNQEALEYAEPYPYHPHITLAQGLLPEHMPAALDLARRRWDAYTGPRSFACSSWFFVRGAKEQGWVDLVEIKLNAR